ncbi:MAG TPA: DUF6569 family protein [Candidatus Angelobacter sp.]|nr:DUF6569 family protein [Candidatus Angelobacter sp.]
MTPKTISSSTILQAISEESMGFKFGKPERPNESSLACILPILRETSQVRQYITLPETEQVLVFDSGTINKVNLKNASKSNVFVRSGTIFEGKGTQTRALMRSAVLFPGTEVALDVRCIHQTHGIRTGAEFKYGGITPLSVDSAVYSAGYRPQDQHTTWNAVRRTTSSMRTMAGSPAPQETVPVPKPTLRGAALVSRLRWGSGDLGAPVATEAPPQPASVPIPPTPAIGRIAFGPADDNLKQNFDEFARSFDAILSKAHLQENQVGLALITDTGCKTIELFDLAASWEAIHKDAVKRMGTELLRGPDNTSVFEYKPENAVNAVRKVLGLDYKTNLIYEHKPSNGEPHVAIFGLTASRYVGEIVELDGRVIHLNILETAVA